MTTSDLLAQVFMCFCMLVVIGCGGVFIARAVADAIKAIRRK